jgi:hypothetical protein
MIRRGWYDVETGRFFAHYVRGLHPRMSKALDSVRGGVKHPTLSIHLYWSDGRG